MKSCQIVTFAQFEEGNLVENEHNVAEDNELIPDSIDDSFTDDDPNDGFINTKKSRTFRMEATYIHKLTQAMLY